MQMEGQQCKQAGHPASDGEQNHNQKQDQSKPDIVAENMAFWAERVARLRSMPRLPMRNVLVSIYAKLRCSQAGLYQHWGMWKEAEQAFREAREICNFSPEANTRLAQCFVDQREYGAAIAVLTEYLEVTPDSERAREMIKRFSGEGDLVGDDDDKKQSVMPDVPDSE